MTKYRAITIGILIAVAALLIAWDIYVYVVDGTDSTISRVLLWLGAHPVVPFSLGVLMGHLFWPQRLTKIVQITKTEGTSDAEVNTFEVRE